MRLQTDRLIVRPVRPSDREPIARLWSSSRVTRYLGGIRDRAAVRRALREYGDPEARFDLWTVEEQESGRVVGHCGLLPRRLDGEPVTEVIYVFGSRHWGKGYATEVAAALVAHAWTLGCPEVYAFIDPGNLASQRVAARLGFVHERTIPLPAGHREQVWVVRPPGRPGADSERSGA